MTQPTITFDSQLQQQIQNVATVAGYLWQKGWAEINAGNISVNITELVQGSTPSTLQILSKEPQGFRKLTSRFPALASHYLLVTGSGTRMRDVATNPFENLCVIKITEEADGYQMLWGSGGGLDLRPTSELPSHLLIHQQLHKQASGANVIVHTHPDELIALTLVPEFSSEEKLNALLLTMHPETIIAHPKGVGVVPYMLPGTDEIARATIRALEQRTTVIWQKHGCLATGRDVFEAFDRIDTLVKAANIFFLCKQAGYTPEVLTQAQLRELKRKYLKED
jgi:rhamnulose-1-phosphate aldolase